MFIIRFLILCLSVISPFTMAVALTEDKSSFKVLTWAGWDTYLPRAAHPQDLEVQYLQQFAELHGLNFEQIKVAQFDELFTKLAAGEGDVIAANLTVTKQRKKLANFTEAFIQSNEYLLMGKNSKELKSGKDLNGREVVIQKGKSYELTALGLQKVYPKMRIRYIDTSISTEVLYDRLASGEYDLAIQDQNLINAALDYRDDIKQSLQASGKRDIAWAVALGNKNLQKKLNYFLFSQKLAATQNKFYANKWKKIKATRTIRFVLRNNLSSYYIWRGELLGFHYELAKRFAKEHKLRYEIIVAPNNVALLDYLIEDKADIALGFLTPTASRRAKGIDFSRPYHYASELVIGGDQVTGIETPEDLSGHTIYTRASSAYWSTAVDLQKTVKNLKLVAVPENMETESILEAVGDKQYEMTIADSHIVDIEMTFRDDIQSFMALGEPKAQSWAVKAGNDELLKYIDKFLKKHYKGLFYNVIYNKYFKNKKRLDKQYKGYIAEIETGVMSPYDDLVKVHAKEFNFDWRLLVAQMHQESRFNPSAKSMAGAQGLFQVMPRTAQQLGISDMHDPEKGIEAGIRYMDWVRKRMQADNIPDSEIIWFTLASYNAGAGHVRDAMRLARQKGWRDDIWFNHVEQAMLLLSQPKYAAKARYGYVRGQEPVTYVREIKRRYDTYLNITNHK
ncbi:transporter substrate-binding domain-containing protein [Psychromonas sp. RZ22]|uniref:transporter substrate-binding domain-containing protein n=1 Tax=Psychromonas algarum TaxID=2555643 RepID=UPI0010676EE8|nr:transporter substrate-binding domain-containing protein [Psychromonas sp. RZ22]TEW54990.1 transporter substrate-binding domain-containing protein [Psychromonas sp. RZ22]